jgi:hypothetical protein
VTSRIQKSQLASSHHYPGLTTNAGCAYCGRWSRLQTPAVIAGDQTVDHIHGSFYYVSSVERRKNIVAHTHRPWDIKENDWIDEWAQSQDEASISMFN